MFAGAAGYMLFDVAMLGVCFAAFGLAVPPAGVLLMAYLIGQLGGLIPLPGGVGGVDGGLIGTLVLYGAGATAAATAVLAYRAIVLLLPLALGVPALRQVRRRLQAEAPRGGRCDPGRARGGAPGRPRRRDRLTRAATRRDARAHGPARRARRRRGDWRRSTTRGSRTASRRSRPGRGRADEARAWIGGRLPCVVAVRGRRRRRLRAGRAVLRPRGLRRRRRARRVRGARGRAGRAIGRRLLDEICLAAEAAGLHKLTSRIFSDNAASIAAHEAAGFVVVGVQRRHGRLDGEWRDCVVVERLLGDAAR